MDNRIAELILNEQECYQATIAYAHRLGRKVQRVIHAGDKALCEAQIQKLLDAGYTRPEPTENQVEAVANLLCGDCNHQANHRCQPQGTDAMDCYGDLARSILKLCQPELTLTDKEQYAFQSWRKRDVDEMHRIVLAALRDGSVIIGQYKGQPEKITLAKGVALSIIAALEKE